MCANGGVFATFCFGLFVFVLVSGLYLPRVSGFGFWLVQTHSFTTRAKLQ